MFRGNFFGISILKDKKTKGAFSARINFKFIFITLASDFRWQCFVSEILPRKPGLATKTIWRK